jgi:hypothetical protein
MPGQAVSDAVINVQQVCSHGIRLLYGAQIDHPVYNRLHPQPPGKEPVPTLYRLIQAASPPPSRSGKPWEHGLFVNEQPLDPNNDNWQQGVTPRPGIPSLGQPKPFTIILDEWLTLPHRRGEMPLTDGDPLGFLSVPYLQPRSDSVVVNYRNPNPDGYTLHWHRPLATRSWVAISFDRFWPPERDSADYIAQIKECTGKNCIEPHGAQQTV